MSEEATATKEFDAAISKIGDKIAGLTLTEAVSLADYMKETYGIEPAAGGAVMMAPADTEDVEVEQTEFDVVLTGFGDKKLNVVKLVKTITGATLMESKKIVEACPATLKEKVSKEEAEKVKAEVEAVGGTVELK